MGAAWPVSGGTGSSRESGTGRTVPALLSPRDPASGGPAKTSLLASPVAGWLAKMRVLCSTGPFSARYRWYSFAQCRGEVSE